MGEPAKRRVPKVDRPKHLRPVPTERTITPRELALVDALIDEALGSWEQEHANDNQR